MIAKLTGRGVLLWVTGFFGVIIATNVFFVAMSLKTFSGEDELDPYLQGSHYNHTLADRTEQARLGWRALISSGRSPTGQLEIAVANTHADSSPVAGVSLAGQLRHPADQGRDHPLHFHEVRPGAYAADLASVTPGRWEVVVQNTGKTPFEARRKIWVR